MVPLFGCDIPATAPQKALRAIHMVRMSGVLDPSNGTNLGGFIHNPFLLIVDATQ